ncbi:MAG: hypothetical protein GTN84_11280 [Hydrogenophaga sp.]|nr:hypothetical protein [Hydrogenophaga sp.]NIM41667.1 hypothetical protein [Hydrogenophaga sp.]NIN26972.1 hypothetical protein [Hydrogenophaga sp.]NIN31673.1 hypothetical protein [Hydrogenophaga sp.]NIN55917.1 hypothetical protein [Hydrogenophaga sp.]NIO52044.1 hypothetical protein [Hydrogenophaga sp.]
MTALVVPLAEAHFPRLHEVRRQYGRFQVDGETFDSHAMALLRQGSR